MAMPSDPTREQQKRPGANPRKPSPTPTTGPGIQGRPRGGPVASPMPAQKPGMGGAAQKPGMRADLISRVRGVKGLSPVDQANLTSAIQKGGRGALRDMVQGQPYAQDVLQAINANTGAGQNAPGQRPAVKPVMGGAPGGSGPIMAPTVQPPAAEPAPSPVAAPAQPAALAPPPSPSPAATSSLAAPAPPTAPPPSAPMPPADRTLEQSGHTRQEWGQVNQQLSRIDPNLVAQWRAEMEQIPAGGGARFNFLQEKLKAHGAAQQPTITPNPQPPVAQTPPIYVPPGGGMSGGPVAETPPIYVPPQLPQGEQPQQFPDIFNPVFF